MQSLRDRWEQSRDLREQELDRRERELDRREEELHRAGGLRGRHDEHVRRVSQARLSRARQREEQRLARARMHVQRHQLWAEQMRWRQEMRRVGRERQALARQEAKEHAIAVRRGLWLAWWSLRTVPAAVFVPFGLLTAFMRPPTIRLARLLAGGQRKVLEQELGTSVPRGEASPGEPALRDPAVRREVRWLLCAPALGLLAALPGLMVGFGTLGLVLWAFGVHLWVPPGIGAFLLPVLLIAGNGISPQVLRAYETCTVGLLCGPASARLRQRVRRLTETRADAVDAQAAELRRIERDLHDGVQARLVAMGLNLGAVEQLMERDPAAAKALLAQSREASASALDELRALVRGIHPPVLAERGLADAVRALALDSPLKTEVTEDLVGRAEPPVESAVYFAVSELLTNAARHADARRVWIDLHHTGEALRVQVTDDGHGGADARDGRGSGLRGIERRLGTFDGVLAVSSPQGGPTIVTLELPCVLSSPRTSTS
jgi:signal transduction histidine kinase